MRGKKQLSDFSIDLDKFEAFGKDTKKEDNPLVSDNNEFQY